jgi:hypothetical protein
VTSASDRSFAGLRVRSAIALPDLIAWSGGDRAPDIVIEMGHVPDILPDLVIQRPLLQVSADGACRYAIADIAAWWIAPDGSRVIVEMKGTDLAGMRNHLYGSVFAILLMRRRYLPLHACCVERDGRAFAISGVSGAGKSSLAIQLVRCGYRMLADDVTAIDLSTPGSPVALPTFPRIKLWQDMLDRLDMSAAGLEPVTAGMAKYSQPVTAAAFCDAPRPLAALLLLDADLGPGRLSPMQSLQQLPTIIYRQQMMLRLGLGEQQMRQYLALISATGGCTAIRRPETPQALDALLTMLAG